MNFKTTDLCDQYSDELDVCEPLFDDYGGKRRFAGPVATIKCFEDNSRVRERRCPSCAADELKINRNWRANNPHERFCHCRER